MSDSPSQRVLHWKLAGGYVDEVLYARFPELVPDGFKESGNYVSSCNLSDAIIKRKDLDELKALLKTTFEKLR